MRLATGMDAITDQVGVRRTLLVLSSIGAGVIHAAVVPEHLDEAWAFGGFFILAAGFQIGWAIPVVLRRSVSVYLTGALANGAMIGIWVVSRTIGLPIGPEPWMAEPAGTLDVAATCLELLPVAGSLALLRARPRGDRHGAVIDSIRFDEEVPKLVATVEIAKKSNRAEHARASEVRP